MAAASIFLLWLLPSISHVQKYLGTAGLAGFALAGFAAIAGLIELARRSPLSPGVVWFLGPCLALMAVFPWVYGLANSGTLGGGSDRDDALNVAIGALLAGASPYAADTYLGNAPTPMPGALLLALPFYLAGNAAFQNLLWLPAFALWCRSHFAQARWGLLAFVVTVVGSPGSVQDFLVGGDYLTNALYVLVAANFVQKAYAGKASPLRPIAAIALAIAISSRPIYAVVPLVLAGHLLHAQGARPAVRFALLIGAVAAFLNLPFLLHDPARFPITHLLQKLDGIEAGQTAKFVLPALAIAIAAAASLFRRVSQAPFATIAASLGAMLVSPVVLAALDDPEIANWMWTASYSLPVSLFATIAILEQIDRKTSRDRLKPETKRGA